MYITVAGASGHCHGLAPNHRPVAPGPAVRVELGHFLFVFVHPYPDGNGRIGRFLMNLMLTAAGYPWTVVPVERRDTYMAALEAASVRQDIGPFTDFLAELVGHGAGPEGDAV